MQMKHKAKLDGKDKATGEAMPHLREAAMTQPWLMVAR